MARRIGHAEAFLNLCWINAANQQQQVTYANRNGMDFIGFLFSGHFRPAGQIREELRLGEHLGRRSFSSLCWSMPVGFAAVALNGLWATYAQVPGAASWRLPWDSSGAGLLPLGPRAGDAGSVVGLRAPGHDGPVRLHAAFLPGHADKAATPGGLVIIAGILVCIVGVAINGMAGIKREKCLPGQRACRAADKEHPDWARSSAFLSDFSSVTRIVSCRRSAPSRRSLARFV